MTGGEITLDKLLDRNRAWADRIKQANPDYFENLSKLQAPDLLWIGCSDSRVPANVILDLAPGEVFVHRNIANVVVPSDLNCLSVLQFAVEVLKINHVIVCGHYGCGGVRAALSAEKNGLIDNWLNHIREIRRLHADKFDADMSEAAEEDLLCELNVLEQVSHVCGTTIVQDAWARGMPLTVHGVVYSLNNGILNPLCERSAD